MSVFANLEPALCWKIFEIICSIPHPSGHTAALAQKLETLAQEQGLKTRRDAIGNLRIDRPGAPGYEKVPTVILQGHLDMVPACTPGKKFDFLHTPITPVVENGIVHADGTTLGADNGGGVAVAMAMLLDPTLQCGPIAALLTVDEEVGLIGARELGKGMLDGACLLSLDNGDDRMFCTGCAGGIRTDFQWDIPYDNAPDNGGGLELRLTGLPGGHSGMCIHERRGNALLFLLRFLRQHPKWSIASIHGGEADNAIPREAVAVVCAPEGPEKFKEEAENFIQQLRSECNAPKEFRLELRSVPRPTRIWGRGFQQKLLTALTAVPDGVLAMAPDGKLVWTSSNFAVLHDENGSLILNILLRSMNDDDRRRATQELVALLASSGAECHCGNEYPGWPPMPDSSLLKLGKEVYRKLFHEEVRAEAIHAGVECGWFVLQNPRLEILSCGPQETAAHTDKEQMEIASMQRVERFIRTLLQEIARVSL